MSSFLAAVCLLLNVHIGNKEMVGVCTIYKIALNEITITHIYFLQGYMMIPLRINKRISFNQQTIVYFYELLLLILAHVLVAFGLLKFS